MTYQVRRQDNTHISIEMDGAVAFELERENEGKGFWGLYPVHHGVRGVRITTDQYSSDLIERITGGLILGGHLARVEGGFVVPVPMDAGDFYVSGTGYLCCRTPLRLVLTEKPVLGHGIRHRGQIRPASLEERAAAGLNIRDGSLSGVFLTPQAD